MSYTHFPQANTESSQSKAEKASTDPRRSTSTAGPPSATKTSPPKSVYNPALPHPHTQQTPRDLHWSLAWAIRGTDPAAWRQIHVVEEKLRPPRWDARYVYWGPLTKSSGPTDDVATRYPLGVFSLAQRARIEELAGRTPVMVPDGTWNCQDWLLDLFARMIAVGLIGAEKRDEVLAAAGYAAGELSSP